jgi:hypothetical protein
MYSYRVVSEASGVPEMTDLEPAYMEEPTSRDGGCIAFDSGYEMNPTPYEPAVGRRCTVIRTAGGRSQECGGAVESVTPVRVALDGGGWR